MVQAEEQSVLPLTSVRYFPALELLVWESMPIGTDRTSANQDFVVKNAGGAEGVHKELRHKHETPHYGIIQNTIWFNVFHPQTFYFCITQM